MARGHIRRATRRAGRVALALLRVGMNVPSTGAGRRGLDAMLGPEPHGAIADEPLADRMGGGPRRGQAARSRSAGEHAGGRPNRGRAETRTRSPSVVVRARAPGGDTDRPGGPAARLHRAPRRPRRCPCSARARAAPSDRAVVTALSGEHQQLRCQPVRPWPLLRRRRIGMTFLGRERRLLPRSVAHRLGRRARDVPEPRKAAIDKPATSAMAGDTHAGMPPVHQNTAWSPRSGAAPPRTSAP